MALGAANASNQVAALKELYTGDSYMKDLVYKKNPLLALMPKDESPQGFAGKYIPVPVIFGSGGGRAATFANAQNSQAAPDIASFFVYRVSDYQIASISNELIEATKDNAGAFVDEAKLVVDRSIRNFTNDYAQSMYASGTGSRGQIASVVTSGISQTIVITLAARAMVNAFERNMPLVVSATDGSAPSSDTVLVTAVDRNAGTITGQSSTANSAALSANWLLANTFLTIQGDVPSTGATTTGTALRISGLAAWLPKTAPTSGNLFWGVDRSQDSRLFGTIAQNTGTETIEEALIDGLAQVSEVGGEPDMVFLPVASYTSLIKELGSKVQYVDVKHDIAEISFQGIHIHAPYGLVTVMMDRNCPAKTAYALQMDTWKVRSLGRVPHMLTYGQEGLEGLRQATADALEIRMGSYSNMICSAPCFNAVIPLSA